MRVQADGAQLHVHLRGPEDGPRVLFIHGFPLTGAMWDAQVECLADKWRLIVPDLRGHGASDVGDGQYAIDFFVDDMFTVLDEVSPELPVVGCGLSMGGYIPLRAFEREPARFRALVFADTKSTADDDAGRLKRLDAVRKIRKEGTAAYGAAFVTGGVGATARAERPEVVEAVKAMTAANDAHGMVGAQLAMAARTDTTAALRTIQVPTLVIVGEEDTLTPPAVAKAMADAVPGGGRLLPIPKAGHLSPMEAPDLFNRGLRDFLESLP